MTANNLKPLLKKGNGNGKQTGARPSTAVYSSRSSETGTHSLIPTPGGPGTMSGDGTTQYLEIPVGFDIHDESSAARSELQSEALSKGFKDPKNVIAGKTAQEAGLEVPCEEYLTSDMETTINILNNIIGCGTLALPYCIAVAGLSAFFCYFFVGYICMYGAKVIIKLMHDENGNRVRFTLFDISQHAFGYIGAQGVRYLQVAQLICSTASFLILAAQVAEAFVRRNIPLDTGGYDLYDCLVVGLGLVFFILSMFMARLKKLAILSIMGGFNSITCISCVCIDCLIFHDEGINIPLAMGYPVFTSIHGLIICVGILLSSFMFHHQVTHHVAEMQNPEKSQGIVNLAGTIVVFGKLIMIAISFGTFVGNTEEIVILNLQNRTLRLISTFCIIIDKLMTFPLYFYTIRMIPEGVIYQSYPKLRNDNQEVKFWVSFPIRVAMMLLIVGTCILFRHISLIMAFSSCIMIFFEIIVPCGAMLLRDDLNWWDAIHCWLLVPLGFLYFFVGTYVNFYYLFNPDSLHNGI